VKRLLLSLVLIALGASFWWLLSRTARFSVKKWDAKFETVLRRGLEQAGVTNADVLSSVHEERKDASGEWVVHRMTVRLPDPTKQHALERSFRDAGADVLAHGGRSPELVVGRGGRVYQEILFK
jgi:hypothetical protein